MVAAKRTAALDHWRARMRDMQCAARWVRHSDLPSPCFLNSDGSPAMNPKEQGHAISRERMPRWTESPEAALPAQLNQAQAFAASLAPEATPFMAPPVWNLTDIIAALRTSAAGLDGLTFQHFRSLDQIYLQALADFFHCPGPRHAIPQFLVTSPAGVHPQRRRRYPTFGGAPRCIQNVGIPCSPNFG